MNDKRVQEAKNEICKMGLGLSIEQEEALKTMVELANDKLSSKLIDKDELMGELEIEKLFDTDKIKYILRDAHQYKSNINIDECQRMAVVIQKYAKALSGKIQKEKVDIEAILQENGVFGLKKEIITHILQQNLDINNQDLGKIVIFIRHSVFLPENDKLKELKKMILEAIALSGREVMKND